MTPDSGSFDVVLAGLTDSATPDRVELAVDADFTAVLAGGEDVEAGSMPGLAVPREICGAAAMVGSLGAADLDLPADMDAGDEKVTGAGVGRVPVTVFTVSSVGALLIATAEATVGGCGEAGGDGGGAGFGAGRAAATVIGVCTTGFGFGAGAAAATTTGWAGLAAGVVAGAGCGLAS